MMVRLMNSHQLRWLGFCGDLTDSGGAPVGCWFGTTNVSPIISRQEPYFRDPA